MNRYSHERYAALVRDMVNKVMQLSELKGGEYSGDDDRLANFRRNGELLGLPMEVIWAVYVNKHYDAVMQFIHDLSTGKERERMETLDSRVDDIIVYMLLFKAMLEERNQ